jgi:hypothetical protein
MGGAAGASGRIRVHRVVPPLPDGKRDSMNRFAILCMGLSKKRCPAAPTIITQIKTHKPNSGRPHKQNQPFALSHS